MSSKNIEQNKNTRIVEERHDRMEVMMEILISLIR
jgi:predicted transcriptional regulator